MSGRTESIPRAQCRCGRPVQGATLCARCTETLARDLGDVPALAEELTTTLTRQDQISGGGRRGADQPLPFNANASAVLGDLRSTLVGWVRELVADTWPDDTLPAMSAWLLCRVDRIRVHIAGDEAADEIGAIVGRARKAIDREPMRIFAGPCGENVAVCEAVRPGDGSRCEGHALGGSTCSASLYGRPGASTVTCSCCGTVHDLDARRETMKAELDSRLCTGAEIALLALYFGTEYDRERTKGLVKVWGQRGIIAPHGVDIAGRPLYRFGEVLARLLKTERRRAS